MHKIKTLFTNLRNSKAFLYFFLLVSLAIAVVGFYNLTGSISPDGYYVGATGFVSLRVKSQLATDDCDLCNGDIEIMPGSSSIQIKPTTRIRYTLITYIRDTPKADEQVYYDTYDIAALGTLMTLLATAGILTRKH